MIVSLSLSTSLFVCLDAGSRAALSIALCAELSLADVRGQVDESGESKWRFESNKVNPISSKRSLNWPPSGICASCFGISTLLVVIVFVFPRMDHIGTLCLDQVSDFVLGICSWMFFKCLQQADRLSYCNKLEHFECCRVLQMLLRCCQKSPKHGRALSGRGSGE